MPIAAEMRITPNISIWCWMQPVTAKTSSHRYACSCGHCESPRLRYRAILWLAVFILGLAHGWLHYASNDHHGHFAQKGDECCLVQSLGGGTAPPIIEVALPKFVDLPFAAANGFELPGLPTSVGYSPRDPPAA